MLILEKLNVNARYDYSLGNAYVGLATFETARSIPPDSVLARDLANPNQFQTYTVRIFEQSGCFTDKSVMLLSAQCGCSPIPVAVIPVSYAICKDEKIPTLNAYTADTTVKISWYSSPSGGTPLSANTSTYTPTDFGVFYVEGKVEKTGCLSTVRTPASLIKINNPVFTVIAKPTTCFGDSARGDGQLVVKGTDIGSFDYSLGDKYTGNGSYGALNLVAPDGIIANNIPNQNQTYTVRVFNKCGLSNDYTVKTNKTTCTCGPLPCFQLQTQRKPKK